NWTVRAFGEAEAQMTWGERLEGLSRLGQEGSVHETPESQFKDTRRHSGKVEFRNGYAQYAPQLPDVLKGASFAVPAGAKVGVIGRTGAGKSTLFGLLHRFIDHREGDILIDDQSIQNFSVFTLRQSIATIPQNPMLFGGTIRTN